MGETAASAQPRVIYDVGANNGDDVEYYLLKADKVVAIEAVPVLADVIRARFPDAISAGRLVVENCVLTVDPEVRETRFWVHKTADVLSQLAPPPKETAHEFEPVVLPASTISEVVTRHGQPHYMKVDLEGFDKPLLADLFSHGIFPPYISAEAHSADVFCTLVAQGGYDAFKLVIGADIGRDYRAWPIATDSGPKSYTFPWPHGSGPFGNDVRGTWLSADAFLGYFALIRPGWVDVHASRVDLPHTRVPRRQNEVTSHLLRAAGLRLRSRRLAQMADRLWGAD